MNQNPPALLAKKSASLTTQPTLTPAAGHKKHPLAGVGVVGEVHHLSPESELVCRFGICVAFLKAITISFKTSCTSTPSGKSSVSSFHSSSVNVSCCAIQPGSCFGLIMSSIMSLLFLGMGRVFLWPSQLSTVLTLTCNCVAKSVRLVPVFVSQSCNRFFNITTQLYYIF